MTRTAIIAGAGRLPVLLAEAVEAPLVFALEGVTPSLAAEPFRLEGREVAVGTSVGVAVHEPGTDAEALMRQADAAMYRHKERRGPRAVRS